MEEREETVEQAKTPYEEPTLEEREDLLQVTEGMVVIVGTSEGVIPRPA